MVLQRSQTFFGKWVESESTGSLGANGDPLLLKRRWLCYRHLSHEHPCVEIKLFGCPWIVSRKFRRQKGQINPSRSDIERSNCTGRDRERPTYLKEYGPNDKLSIPIVSCNLRWRRARYAALLMS
jgi:hypothetical protein